MRMTMYCAQCGREKSFDISTIDENGSYRVARTTLEQIVLSEQWYPQTNGVNFDIYCSKKCAE